MRPMLGSCVRNDGRVLIKEVVLTLPKQRAVRIVQPGRGWHEVITRAVAVISERALRVLAERCRGRKNDRRRDDKVPTSNFVRIARLAISRNLCPIHTLYPFDFETHSDSFFLWVAEPKTGYLISRIRTSMSFSCFNNSNNKRGSVLEK